MKPLKLGAQVFVADQSGDRPAIVTKVLGPKHAELCVFDPLPTVEKSVELHDTRAEALNGELRDLRRHAYWGNP
jgi:hypothetical protein